MNYEVYNREPKAEIKSEIGFCYFIYIASLILNWNPEAAVSRIVKNIP